MQTYTASDITWLRLKMFPEDPDKKNPTADSRRRMGSHFGISSKTVRHLELNPAYRAPRKLAAQLSNCVIKYLYD